MNMFEILSEDSDKSAESIEQEMREAAAGIQQRPSTQILVLCEGFFIKPVYESAKQV